MSIPVSYRARWIFPVDRPPIAHGTLTIVHNRIMAVDPPGRCPADVDLGQVAILPGLVNAHTHLDLGALQGKLKPPGLFTDWLREVVAYRRSSTPDEWTASIRAGIDECLRSGVTLVGDIATGGLSADLLRASPLRSVVFFEVIGLTQSRAEQTWVEFEAWIRLQKRTSRYRPGISPHAPYTVCHWLLLLARGAVEQHGLPLAIHFAETGCEAELLKKHTGPLRRFLEELGAWNEEGLSDSLPWIADTCLSYAPSLFVHGNYFDRESISTLTMDQNVNAPRSVVYCPRTHAFFGHSPHPFRELQTHGINVALGTDSLASNPDLSILAEMRFLRRKYPKMPGKMLLEMGTLAGARALGWSHDVGSLTPGKHADFIAIPVEDSASEPHEAILRSDAPVSGVWINGMKV